MRVWRRYSFEHGPIHFIQLNTEMDFAPGSAQYAWLLSDLRTVNRNRTPWLISGKEPSVKAKDAGSMLHIAAGQSAVRLNPG